MTSSDETVIPAIQVNALKPFASFTLLQCPDDQQHAAFALLWREITRASRAIRVGTVRIMESGLAGIEQYLGTNNNSDLTPIDEANGFIYRTERPCSWAQPTSEYTDIRLSLALLIRQGNLLALHCEAPVSEAVLRWLAKNPQSILRTVPQDILQGAFLKGEAKVLWLRGAHARRATRPDSKQLSGRNLGEALNPLDDNTFAMMSARASLPEETDHLMLKGNIGTTPRKGKVWGGPTQSFQEYIVLVSEVMAAIEETSATGAGVDRPYQILAATINDLSQVSGAYDVAALPPESSGLESEIDSDMLAAGEVLERMTMIVHPRQNSADFTMDVGLDGAMGGSVEAQAVLSRGNVRFKFGNDSSSSSTNPEVVRMALDALRYSDDLIMVYYDSGHSISGGQIIMPSLRPEPFKNWDFRDFSNYDITREKPAGATSPQEIHDHIGKHGDNSLFAWVVNSYSNGYLTCDDGPGEMCDFIHLAHNYTLTYIHVKAAATRSPNRGVAVGAYEVLASQAVKNLSALTTERLRERLRSPLVANPACWVEGEKVSSRVDFLDALDYHGPNDDKLVVLVQPHVNKALYNRVRNGPYADTSPNQARLQLLETLLNGSRGAATCVGGDLVAIGAML